MRNKIAQLHEEAHTLNVSFNTTPISQTANKHAEPNISTPNEDLEEMNQQDLEEMNNRLEKEIEELREAR